MVIIAIICIITLNEIILLNTYYVWLSPLAISLYIPSTKQRPSIGGGSAISGVRCLQMYWQHTPIHGQLGDRLQHRVA